MTRPLFRDLPDGPAPTADLTPIPVPPRSAAWMRDNTLADGAYLADESVLAVTTWRLRGFRATSLVRVGAGGGLRHGVIAYRSDGKPVGRDAVRAIRDLFGLTGWNSASDDARVVWTRPYVEPTLTPEQATLVNTVRPTEDERLSALGGA